MGSTRQFINHRLGARFSDGFQVGELAGGILGGGFYDGLETAFNEGVERTAWSITRHAGAHMGVQAAFAAGGYDVGRYFGGSHDAGMTGAIYGSNLGGIAANFLVACFTRETPIVTSLEGDARRAEWIRKDDLLACRSEFDPQGPLELRRVEEVFVRFAPIVHLHVRDRVIRTTAEHPFYVLDKGWSAAGELQPGDQLVGHDGQFVAVGEVFDTGEFEQVYNFRVADHHTYFVGGNEWGFSVWAHNANYASGNPSNIELPIAPQSRGTHYLQAHFENIPKDMWNTFPAGVPRPTGPIHLLNDAAYDVARAAANRVNRRLSRFYGLSSIDYEVHEIVPVKFGGHPTALFNKVALHETVHTKVTTWFNHLQRLLEG